MIKYPFFNLLLGILLLTNCTSNSSSTADIDESGMGHGHNLTPLGCLLSSSWEYDQFFVGAHNNIVYLDEKNIPIGGLEPYSDNEGKLVFQLKQNGELKYWLKDDIKKVFAMGSWEANFSDSTIKINFGENELHLRPITAKYTTLGSTRMVIEETSFSDELYKGKKEHLKKVKVSYLCHVQALL